MLLPSKINEYNTTLLNKLSFFLNVHSDFIEESIIKEIIRVGNFTVEQAYSVVLAAAVGLDVECNEFDRELFYSYFPEMIHCLNSANYYENSYYKNIKIPELKSGNWEFKQEHYAAYEAFVYNDLREAADGRIIPQIGFFEQEFSYPAVLENGREWMLITPNEIETMKVPIAAATGNVLTYGLGLGYFAYMASEKSTVTSVTVVEKDQRVIELFQNHILPQFLNAAKIKIICDDAFEYAATQMANGNYDLVYTDIWHDPADGLELYQQMKKYEKLSPPSKFMYWIEPTLKCYLKQK